MNGLCFKEITMIKHLSKFEKDVLQKACSNYFTIVTTALAKKQKFLKCGFSQLIWNYKIRITKKQKLFYLVIIFQKLPFSAFFDYFWAHFRPIRAVVLKSKHIQMSKKKVDSCICSTALLRNKDIKFIEGKSKSKGF